MTDATVEFGVLCAMFDAIVRGKKATLKRKHIRTFMEHVYTGHDYFSAMRLILPDLDKERANYGLKETVLARLVADALGLSKESEDAKKLVNWRKGGQRAGSNAGNFSFVCAEVLYRRQKTAPGGLKIRDVNDLLDRLAGAQDKDEKTGVFAEFINKTNAQEMRWIIMIILKDLKLGISEKTVFTEFHPDAEDYFNVTCDLKLVCEKLRDRSIRYKRQDIEVGKAVRPQLAARAASVEDAWKKMRGKEVVVECKFDGERIQVHKNGNKLNFLSRTFTDHPQYMEAIGDVLCQHIIPEKCILDGEMLVWDRVANRFAEFGSNRNVAKGAKDGLDTGQQICYVAFDILYCGDSSVIHHPLRERQRLLQNAIRPLSGRLELLIPEAGGPNSKREQSRWSILASSAEEVQRFFQETVDNREEGVVLKDLDSKWEPSNRGPKWLKLKPDYVQAESDLDVLIIGGYYGSGRRGGEVAQFLLGLAERPKSGGHPTKFHSFCRVGTGLTDEESEQLVHKLKPYFRRNEKGSKPPDFYVLTNAAKERPDVWIDQPEKSVILQIASDIRTIHSEVFASPYSLRFPRVEKIRYDKPWYDCLDVQTLVDTVHSKSGDDGHAGEGGTKGHAKRAKTGKLETKRSLLPSHLLVTDVSHVTQATRLFKDLVFYIANTNSEYPVDKLHKLVVENGGTFSMNLCSVVTHAVAFEKKGLKYHAASKNRDVIHLSWILDCLAQKALLSVGSKYYLHMSDATKGRLKSDVDEFGDFYFIDIDEPDLIQVFGNMDIHMEEHDMEKVKYYTKKYCPTPTWTHFSGCCVFFLHPLHSTNEDTRQVAKITLKRLALEVEMHEGTVSEKLTRKVTHIVAYASSESSVAFQSRLKSVSSEERRRLLSKRVRVVSHHWIEDSVGSNSCLHPAEDKYDLRSGTVLESEDEEEEEKEEVAILPKSKSLTPSIIPITPDKTVAPRPPRKPIARKRALPLGGRGRGRRGSKREESPSGESHNPDEEEHTEQDKAGSTGVSPKVSGANLKVRNVTGVESSPTGAATKRATSRKKDETSSHHDGYPPKRRLILDDVAKPASQNANRVPTVAEPSNTRTSTRLARKRKILDSDDEEPVAVSKPDESQSIRLDDKDVHQPRKLESQNSPALDAMLSTLLPDYISSQEPTFSSARESSKADSLLVEPNSRMEAGQSDRNNSQASLYSDSLLVEPNSRMEAGQSDRNNSQASLYSDSRQDSRQDSLGTSSSMVDSFDSSNDYRTGTTRGGSSAEGLATGQQSGMSCPPSKPGEKPKVSYKDLINLMMTYK